VRAKNRAEEEEEEEDGEVRRFHFSAMGVALPVVCVNPGSAD
jgi:hypothetical protein